MSKAKPIKICKKCSGLKTSKFKKKAEDKDYKIGCIGRCLKDEPKLKGKVYGYINGKLVVCPTKKKFYKEMEKSI